MSKRFKVHENQAGSFDIMLGRVLLAAVASIPVLLCVILQRPAMLLIIIPLVVLLIALEQGGYSEGDYVVFYPTYARQLSIGNVNYSEIKKIYVGSYVYKNQSSKSPVNPRALYIVCLDEAGEVRLQIHYSEEVWNFISSKCRVQATDTFHSHYKSEAAQRVVLNNAESGGAGLESMVNRYRTFLD